MRNIVIILLLLLSATTYSQQLYKVPMIVIEVGMDTTICEENVEVIWGYNPTYLDTMAFIFKGKTLVFYPFHDYKKDIPEKIKELNRKYENSQSVLLKKDKWDEYYQIELVINNYGYYITISNILYSWPHYRLCFSIQCECY